ncbi:MAG: HDOD domain-containing protein [Phycisphaerae bacterium]
MPSTQSIIDKIRADPKIPAPSQTVFRILELTKDPNCSINQVAHTVQRDSGLVAQLLREANSALYGFNSPTSSIAEACMRLGMKRVRSAVINRHVVDGLGRARPAGFDSNRYWQSAFAMSVAGRDLAGKLLPETAEDAATAGLLCDIGIGLLAFGVPDIYRQVIAALSGPAPDSIQDIERRVLGVTHAEVGAAVLTDWKLEGHIIAGVQHHHTDARKIMAQSAVSVHEGDVDGDDEARCRFSQIVAAAVTISDIALNGSDMDRVGDLFDRIESLSDDADALVNRLLDKLVEHIQQSAESLSVEIGSVETMQTHFEDAVASLPNLENRMSYRPMTRDEITGEI